MSKRKKIKKRIGKKRERKSSASVSQNMTDVNVTKGFSDSNKPSPDAYDCYLCDDFSGETAEIIGNHVKKDHLKRQDGFGCTFESCAFRSLSMAEIHEHYEKAHQEDYKKSICSLCSEERENEDELERHVRLVHLMDYEFQCKSCKKDKKFSSFYLDEWYDHVKQHHPKAIPKLEICRNDELVKNCNRSKK